MALPVIEFRVDGFIYKAKRMDPFVQLALLAKISPLMAAGFVEVVTLIFKVKRDGFKSIVDAPKEDILKVIGPVAEQLSKMPDADRRYVIESCMDVCDRCKEGEDQFVKIWNQSAQRSMFQDIDEDISVILKITLGVIDGTFARFFPEGLSHFLSGALLGDLLKR